MWALLLYFAVGSVVCVRSRAVLFSACGERGERVASGGVGVRACLRFPGSDVEKSPLLSAALPY